MDFTKINVSLLKAANYNPRKDLKPGDKEYEKIRKSIEEYGYIDPIIVNTDYTIIGGHQRAKVLKDLGYKEVDCVIVEVDKIKEKALNVALNKISGDWDAARLEQLMQELYIDLDDIEITGFDEQEYFELIGKLDDYEDGEDGPEETTDIDKIIENVIDPISKRGDVWLLGKHRLMCGDSTEEADLNTLMDGKTADMVFTDPPYNVAYDAESRVSYFSPERLQNKLGSIKNDKKTDTDFFAFLNAVYTNINNALKPGGPIYICHADTEGHHFRNAFKLQPWHLQSCLIWLKTVLVFGRADYHWKHEPILYGWKEGANHIWVGDRKQTSVIEYATDHYNKKEADTDGYVHPTQKPTGLIKIFLNNSSEKGNLILDLFGGSGSTMIASEMTGRACNSMELDEKFVDVIVQRYIHYKNSSEEVFLIRGGVTVPYCEIEQKQG